MAAERIQVIDRLRQRLLAEAGAAGWGYYAGKSSRIEPTSWALVALRAGWDSGPSAWAAFAEKHLSFLSAIQRPDGLLVETEVALANLAANGVALMALSGLGIPTGETISARLRDGLLTVKGVRLPQSDAGQDNQLQGWPWLRDTFSWIEPTAWCLLGLKMADDSARAAGAASRILEAERLLVNRVCVTGGWNYGNASTLGQDLRPYVPTTAIALLAMQDRRGETAVVRSAKWLADDRLSEPTTVALSLTAVCLKLYGLPSDDVDERLMDVVQRSENSGHLQGIAMAAYALSADDQNLEALRVRA